MGTKIMWAYFRDFVRLARRRGLQDVRPCEVPAAVLPNLGQFVWMHRRDTTRQAVSLWKALQTQQWRRDSDEDIGGRGLRFSFAAIDHLKLRIDEHNAAWQDFFYGCGVEPMEVAIAGSRSGISRRSARRLSIRWRGMARKRRP